MEVLLTIIAIVAIIAFFVLYSAFAWGYVLFKFWYWFLLPVFPNVPHIYFLQAVGLMFVIGLFKNQVQQQGVKKELRDDSGLSSTTQVFINPIITLLCGLLIHSI